MFTIYGAESKNRIKRLTHISFGPVIQLVVRLISFNSCSCGVKNTTDELACFMANWLSVGLTYSSVSARVNEELMVIDLKKAIKQLQNTCGLILTPTRDEQRITEPNTQYSFHHVDYCAIPSLLYPLT